MNTILKICAAVMVSLAALALAAAPREASPQEVSRLFAENASGHPRLFLRDYRTLEESRKTATGSAMTGRILHDAGKMLGYPVVERRMTGNQMLSVSRNILYRINTLAIAYRLSGDRRYADKAVAEMRNAAAFPDWNPQHFLDVAELTLAMAFGYDWLYDLLDENDRQLFEQAIIEKGILPSYGESRYNWWVKGTNNWNQVCHAGMTAGALAVFERNPELAAKTIARAVNCLPPAMRASYYPKGAYPEGPVYWSYGSEFNVALLAMLESALGTDFGLASMPGFSETGDYVLAVRAPSGRSFSYADSVPFIGVDFAQVWLPKRFNRPDWMSAWAQQELLNAGARRNADVSKGGPRMLPLAMIFFSDYRKTDREPPKSYFSGADAAVPVAMFRSDWSDDAAYLGVKAGSPSWAHGHMDAGSFVYEVDGVRWAADLGQDNYDKFLARGMTLWNSAQESDRWKIFRFGPLSHNILMIDGQLQQAANKAEITGCTENSAVVDLSPVYAGQAKNLTRSFRLLPDRSVEISDRIEGAKPGAVVRWQMLIQGSDAEIQKRNLLLANGEKRLLIEVDSPQPGKWSITDTKELEAEWDAPNPGCRMIAFEQAVPAGGSLAYTVRLKPQPAQVWQPGEPVTLGMKRQPREERVLSALPLKPGRTVRTTVKPIRKYGADSAWKSCGVGIHRDARNQFLFSFCESPASGGSRRFLELKQRKNGQWESVAGIRPVECRSNFNWKYGEEYVMELAVSAAALTGTLKSPDGGKLAEITIPVVSDEAVNSGNTLLFSSGIEAAFTGAGLP